MHKGQVSLETLLLLSAMVGVLYISLSLLSRTYSLGTAAISSSASESLLRELASTANEVCAMGEGNSRVVSSNPEISLSYSGGMLSLVGGTREYSQPVKCPLEIQGEQLSGNILVENTGKLITMREFSPE